MKRFTIGAAAALLLSACSMGQDVESPDAALDLPDVADGTLSEETMKRVTERLSSDEFEGRAPGTAGEEKTIAYLIEEFGKAGPWSRLPARISRRLQFQAATMAISSSITPPTGSVRHIAKTWKPNSMTASWYSWATASTRRKRAGTITKAWT